MTIQDYLDRAMGCLRDVRLPEPDVRPSGTVPVDLTASVEDIDRQVSTWVEAMETCPHPSRHTLASGHWHCLGCGVEGCA